MSTSLVSIEAGEVIHSRKASLEYLLRAKERQLHDLQRRCDEAATILDNALLSTKPNWKHAVQAASAALVEFSNPGTPRKPCPS
jgi:hypothetical protein